MDECQEDDSVPVKPFLCRINEEVVLTGQLNSHGHIEWEWSRVCDALKLETQKDGLLLKRGLEEFRTEFLEAQLSFSEFHYRGKDAGPGSVGKHTMESRALILMLCLLPLRRQTRVQAKEMAWSLLQSLVGRRIQKGTHSIDITVPGPLMNGEMYILHVEFQDGVTCDLEGWVSKCNQAAGKWENLKRTGWCKHKITTSLGHAPVFDVLLWCASLKASPKSNGWLHVGHFLWPKLLFLLGQALEQFALTLTERKPEAAPLLRTRAGHSKTIPWVNKLVLLRRVGKAKSHRKKIMQSHGDIVPEGAGLVSRETLIECSQYMGTLGSTFEECNHMQISWDPSNYSGDDVMVVAVWSNQCNCAAWLPIEYLLPVKSVELELEISALAQRKQVTRVHGYCELRAVSHALQAIGKSIASFEIPKEVHWQALSGEVTASGSTIPKLRNPTSSFQTVGIARPNQFWPATVTKVESTEVH